MSSRETALRGARLTRPTYIELPKNGTRLERIDRRDSYILLEIRFIVFKY